jgi:cytochrome c2
MRIGQWIGRGLATVVGLGLLTVGGVYGKSQSALATKATPPNRKALTIPTDSASLALGRKLTTVNGCRECHSASLGGKVMVDDGAFGRLVSANLTSGQGGVLSHYDDRALDAAIRDGVGWDGRKLFIMPSAEYSGFADADVAAIIADIRASAAVNNALPPMALGPIARALVATGKIEFAYDLVDHNRTTLAVAPTGGTVEHGRYLAAACKGCHMQDYGGGPMPGAAPGAKPSANLTPSGNIGKWSQAEFTRVFREGTRPDGSKVDSTMPWEVLGKMSDEELQGIYLYLKTLPAKTVASK